MRPLVRLAVLLCTPLTSSGQEKLRLAEAFTPGYQYQVSCRVEIQGSLTLPPQKDGKAPAPLSLTGNSAIDYQERLLPPLKDAKGERTLRVYRKMDFNRKVGEQVQETSLRPEVKRLVILRSQQLEVPFSPDGPLLWNEIDLVRTDVFTPALVGLLPASEVRAGDAWPASEAAMRELTDLEKLESAKLTCTFETVTTLAGRRLARVKLEGAVQGIGEDGPARHELTGYFLFDLESNHISYLFVKGMHAPLDKAGKAQGKIEGTFVLTRQPTPDAKELADDTLRGLKLEPNEDNTRLLLDAPEIGVRLLHPRRWRVVNLTEKQITLNEPSGSGLLITLEPLAKTPKGVDFLQEARGWLVDRKAPISDWRAPKAVVGAEHLEHFWMQADVDKQRVLLDYYVARFAQGGATLAARLFGPEQAVLREDVNRMARSLRITKKL